MKISEIVKGLVEQLAMHGDREVVGLWITPRAESTRPTCHFPGCGRVGAQPTVTSFCVVHAVHGARSCGLDCCGIKGHPGLCDPKRAETPAPAGARQLILQCHGDDLAVDWTGS